MRNLDKSKVLTSIEPINRTSKKNAEKNNLKKIWVQNVPISVKVVCFVFAP